MGILESLPLSEGAKAAATIPLLLVPAAFAYQEDVKELIRNIKFRLFEKKENQF